MMTIGLAMMLTNEAHNFIRKIQLELHQKFGFRISRQHPHITIKVPFEVENIDPYSDYLSALANDLSPFPVHLKGFHHFDQKILFLDVVENNLLTQLHFRMLAELGNEFGIKPHNFEGDNIKFHATIAGYENPEDFLLARSYLKKYQPEFHFQVSELGLFYHLGGNNGWIVWKKCRLGLI